MDRLIRGILTLAIQESQKIRMERMRFRVLLFILNCALNRSWFDIARQAASSFSEEHQKVAGKLKVDLIEMVGIEDYRNPVAAMQREMGRLLSNEENSR